jgi:hypothetical protein
MELNVWLDKESCSITIDNPFRLDMAGIAAQIGDFLEPRGEHLNGLDIEGLLPRMVKGIAGCEAGCPSDAMSVVRKGHQAFKLEYIEGGILTAKAETPQGKTLTLKLFPDF